MYRELGVYVASLRFELEGVHVEMSGKVLSSIAPGAWKHTEAL